MGPMGQAAMGPALAPKFPWGIPLELLDAAGPFSPEQVMKAGVFPRELVLLKQSSREWFPQESTTSHCTGRWIPGSGSLWPFLAVPQRNSWQMRVSKCVLMLGDLATAPHSPCLYSSRKPEQLKFPSTSRSLGGPGEGLVLEEVIDWDGTFFSHYLVGKFPNLRLQTPQDEALTRGLRGGGRGCRWGFGSGFHWLWNEKRGAT